MDSFVGQLLYFVESSKELGRYLVAAKDIEARTHIIYERPLVSGAADDDSNFEAGEIPVCLGCSKRMGNYGDWNRCTLCGWPVCSTSCESAEIHSQMECSLFTEFHVPYPPRHSWPILNKTILVLRILLLKSQKPREWNDVIIQLEHHTDIRHTKPYCKKGDEMILENFAHFRKCGLPSYAAEDWTDALIVRVSGIINVNCFSSTKSEIGGNGGGSVIMQCLYPEASLLAHSCIPNCTWTVNDDDLRISIRVATPINCGEMITIAYNQTEIGYGTLHRLISMEDVAHFICHCGRCRDPTEMGTFVSAVKCFDCEKGWLLPEEAVNPESIWRCGGGIGGKSFCGGCTRVKKVVLFLNEVDDEFQRINERGYSREEEMKRLEERLRMTEGNRLHENHYILQQIRMKIVKSQWGFLERLEWKEVNSFVEHCRVLLRIADVLTPGFSKIRALLQFFLTQGLLRLATISKSISCEEFDENQKENDEEEDKTRTLYKEIYGLQTRALLYFGDMQEQHNSSAEASSQFTKCIKRQLKNVERQLR